MYQTPTYHQEPSTMSHTLHDLLAPLPVAKSVDTSAIQFVLNLPFDTGLDVCRNTQFTGQMAVTLSRSNLPLFEGMTPVFPLYERALIDSSLKPRSVRLPPVYGVKPTNTNLQQAATMKLSHATVDFGSPRRR